MKEVKKKEEEEEERSKTASAIFRKTIVIIIIKSGEKRKLIEYWICFFVQCLTRSLQAKTPEFLAKIRNLRRFETQICGYSHKHLATDFTEATELDQNASNKVFAKSSQNCKKK